jgi:hypothetical protein
MARARRKRAKRKRPPAGFASDDASHDAAPRAILTDIRRLERHAETEWRRRMRDIGKLTSAGKPANARKLTQVQHRLRDAELARRDVDRLRRDVESIIASASARLAALEVEATASMNTAIVRYLVARAMRGDTAEPEMARIRPGDFATALAKAKDATAIVIADRNKMRDALSVLTPDAERTAAADEWRRALAVQEAAVAHLKEGVRLLVAKQRLR